MKHTTLGALPLLALAGALAGCSDRAQSCRLHRRPAVHVDCEVLGRVVGKLVLDSRRRDDCWNRGEHLLHVDRNRHRHAPSSGGRLQRVRQLQLRLMVVRSRDRV